MENHVSMQNLQEIVSTNVTFPLHDKHKKHDKYIYVYMYILLGDISQTHPPNQHKPISCVSTPADTRMSFPRACAIANARTSCVWTRCLSELTHFRLLTKGNNRCDKWGCITLMLMRVRCGGETWKTSILSTLHVHRIAALGSPLPLHLTPSP